MVGGELQGDRALTHSWFFIEMVPFEIGDGAYQREHCEHLYGHSRSQALGSREGAQFDIERSRFIPSATCNFITGVVLVAR